MATASLMSAVYNATEDEERRCRACFSTSIFTDWAAGDRVCTECGVVDQEHLLDERPEWREFDDEAPTAPVRCGLVPNDEKQWIGGLQPTTLSKYVFGGATLHSSRMRKTLIKCNQIIERKIEKRYVQERKEAQMDAQIRKRKRREEGFMGDDDDEDDDMKPKFEKFVLDEDDSALTRTAALYDEKWSLSRCLQLFGRPEEQISITSDEHQTIEDLRQNLDSVLTAASKQLYCAYSILIKAGRILRLPESVLNDAANYLSGYAARKDSLAVRGVASQLKRDPAKKVSLETHKQAQRALRDYNCVKQYSSLSSALLFYTARRNGHPRPLAEVHRAIPCDSFKTSPHFEWTKGEPMLKLKHCSRAMSEVAKVFPDLAKNPADAVGSAHGVSVQGDVVSSMDASSLQNYVNHATKNLRLPPVAEACLQILIQLNPGPEKLPLRTASLTYFLGLVGKTMQKLASQSNPRKVPRRTRSTQPALAKDAVADNGSEETATQVGSCEEVRSDANDGMLTNIAAEERAYEMQRVWSAWKDQTPWARSLPEISQATQVPAHQIRDHYKQRIHPERHVLLQRLAESRSDIAPMSSVLLPYISLAAPLIKDP
uniref:TFIIB-type domain-containing protein n=1 Tax=Amphora coffeiformis TaxID=265554 RepID=A0A7S3L342_9STRA|eukprot:scaffold2418_cov175-Amphora_coffeaeformis.AAC.9